MADLFESYEEEFNDLRVQIEQRTKLLPTYDANRRRDETNLAEADLKSLDATLRQMNLSGRNNTRLMTKIKDYEQELVRLRATLRRADMSVGQSSDRNDLFSGIRTDEVMAASMGQRERLITANERLERMNYDIDNTHQVALETIDVGVGILNDLDEQTEKMRNMKGNLGDIDESLDKAKRIMKSMARRAMQNKLIFAVIALVLVAAIALIIYVKWFAGSSTSQPITVSTTGIPGNATSGYLTTADLTTSHL